MHSLDYLLWFLSLFSHKQKGSVAGRGMVKATISQAVSRSDFPASEGNELCTSSLSLQLPVPKVLMFQAVNFPKGN